MAEIVNRIKTLVKKRGTIKSKLTHFKNFIDDESKNSDLFQLKKRLQNISEDFISFETYQDELDLLYESDADTEIQKQERVDFADLYFEYSSKAEKLIFDLESASTTNLNNSHSIDNNSNQNLSSASTQQFLGSHI